MNSESIARELVIGLVVLIVYVLLASGRRIAALRSSLLAAIIGAVAYPLARCALMGVAAGSNLQPGGAWSRFRYAYFHFGESAPAESIPRGAVLGVFVVACWALWRRSKTRWPRPFTSRVPGPTMQDALHAPPATVAESLPARASAAMQTAPPEKDPISELAAPARRRTVTDYVTLAVAGAIAAVVLFFVFAIALEHGNPRIVGPPHWSDKYFRAAATAFWVAVLALLFFGMWRDYCPK